MILDAVAQVGKWDLDKILVFHLPQVGALFPARVHPRYDGVDTVFYAPCEEVFGSLMYEVLDLLVSIEQGIKSVAVNLIKMGKDNSLIMQATNLSEAAVENLRKSICN